MRLAKSLVGSTVRPCATPPRAYSRFVSLQDMLGGQQGHLLDLGVSSGLSHLHQPCKGSPGRKKALYHGFLSEQWDGLWSIFPGFLRSVAMTQKPLVP